MSDLEMLDAAFHFIMGMFTETGRAPHFTDLAAHLRVSVDQGRQLFHDLEATGYSFFLHPETDQIVSVAPFNNLPTQYRISIDGEQKWFAQCGFEALAIRWLFPGKTVRMDAPCLDCGQPMAIVMRDEQVLSVEPETIVGYSLTPIGVGGPGRAYR